MSDEANYVKTECGRDRWYPTVPSGVWDALEIRREAIRDAAEQTE